tara:strand:+ start:551 stop:1489 length:939 start_codon:yes stop_codon:yes gene_type:complete
MVFEKHNRLALAYDRFPGGIINPSLVEHAGEVWGIARCEKYDQAERNADKSLNFTPAFAVMFRLNENLAITKEHYDVRFENFPSIPWRTEDYRLFVFQGQLFCTHTLWVQGFGIGMGLSQVDVDQHSISLLHPITIENLKVNTVEKNWVIIPHQDTLHCLYSFYPEFTLTELLDLHTAKFSLSHRKNLQSLSADWLPATGLEDKLISLSTVPQQIQNELYLLVHQKDEQHIYRDFLVKIDATTMMPIAISREPVIKGGDSEGFWRGFLTVYSLLILGNQAIVSFGEGERYAGVAKAPVESLLNAETLALCEN